MDYISILISYNDDNITKLLTTIIDTRYNAQIDIVRNASEFFDSTGSTKYDVILMDCLFSKDAFNVIERFRRKEECNQAPIAIFISHLTEEYYMRAVDLDIFDFLSKPFSLEHIYLAIDYIMHKKNETGRTKTKRTSIRIDRKLFMKYSLRGSSQTISEGHVVTTENISMDGVMFSDHYKFRKDDKLQIEIMLNEPNDSNNIITEGVIKWTKGKSSDLTTVGVEFLDIKTADRMRLNNIIYAH